MAGPDAQPTTLSDVLQTYHGQNVIVGPDTGMPQTLTPQERADTQAAAKRRAEDDWYAYMAENGSTVTGGKVYKLVPDTGTGDAQFWQNKIAGDPTNPNVAEWQGKLAEASGGGDMKAVPDSAGQSIYNQLQIASDLLDREKADAKAAAAGIGAARSYLDTENDKTAEITRQFKNFEDRASALYDLQDSEQGYSMKADDQNAQNRLAISKGALFSGETPVYLNDRPGALLSEILGPSLPDYVSPDYRLNAAVGLPGAEGFNDPQYDANGMPIPQYAWGTESNRSRIEAIAYQYLHGPRFQDEPPAPWHSSAGVMRRA